MQQNAPAIFSLQQQVSAVPSKQDLHAVGLQILLDCQIDFLLFFGSQMADWTVDQFQPRLDSPGPNLFYLIRRPDSLYMGIGPKFQVNTCLLYTSRCV